VFKTLYARLAAALIVLVLLLSSLYLWITLHAGQRFYQEMTQRLNRQLAANLIKDTGLAISNGRYSEASLESVFHTYMVINPSIEVYLLDPGGHILAFSAPPGSVKSQQVDLVPVRAFLQGKPALPLLSDDPRHPGQRKIFSVAPIGDADSPQGYLYVVLAGEQLQAIAQRLRQSHITRYALYAIALSTVLALFMGLLVLRYQTRRLRALSMAMQDFDLDRPAPFQRPDPAQPFLTDDIGVLQQTFARMAERIKAQIDSLQQTDTLRRELVANVSHDLRTPLAALQGYLETLLIKRQQLAAEQQTEFLRHALRQCQGLGKLVDALFELAKLDSGQVRLKREKFSLAELVQDVVLKHTLIAREQGVRLEARITENLPEVEADIGLIERVLDNLLDNALRHTPKGGQVIVVVESKRGRLSVSIHDTGSGISGEDLPFIHERYYQSRSRADKPKGAAGLGLAISQRILELHDSQLVIDSATDQGTTVQFTLPVVP